MTASIFQCNFYKEVSSKYNNTDGSLTTHFTHAEVIIQTCLPVNSAAPTVLYSVYCSILAHRALVDKVHFPGIHCQAECRSLGMSEIINEVLQIRMPPTGEFMFTTTGMFW